MKFKSGIFIDEKSLTKKQAKSFVAFLEAERLRHIGHLKEAMETVRDDDTDFFHKVLATTVVARDVEDIEHIDETLALLAAKYNIKVKYCSFRDRSHY